MVRKKRIPPAYLLTEIALGRRLIASHPRHKDIEEKRRQSFTGYKGELNVDYELSFLPDDLFYLFQDVRIQTKSGKVFQIDTLILSLYFALLIESKNIFGTLFFDTQSGQLIRTFGDRTDSFPDPIAQVRKQQALFQEWLTEHLFPAIPMYHLIAIGNPRNTIIKTDDPLIYKKVLHAAHIPDKVLEFFEKGQRSIIKPPLTPMMLDRVSDLLIANHTPKIPDLLTKYKIAPNQLVHGVMCPRCSYFGMVYAHAAWTCPKCSLRSKDSHLQAIYDYLLFHHSITNAQCREFLRLECIHTTKRLLRAADLPISGSFRDRKYLLPDLGRIPL